MEGLQGGLGLRNRGHGKDCVGVISVQDLGLEHKSFEARFEPKTLKP